MDRQSSQAESSQEAHGGDFLEKLTVGIPGFVQCT